MQRASRSKEGLDALATTRAPPVGAGAIVGSTEDRKPGMLQRRGFRQPRIGAFVVDRRFRSSSPSRQLARYRARASTAASGPHRSPGLGSVAVPSRTGKTHRPRVRAASGQCELKGLGCGPDFGPGLALILGHGISWNTIIAVWSGKSLCFAPVSRQFAGGLAAAWRSVRRSAPALYKVRPAGSC